MGKFSCYGFGTRCRRASSTIAAPSLSSRASEARPGTHNHRIEWLKRAGAPAFAELCPVVMGPGSALAMLACPGRQRVCGCDFQTAISIPAAGFHPGLASRRSLLEQRAQGKPGAGCTRSTVCKRVENNAHGFDRYSRDIPAFPAQWLYGLYVLSPVSGLCCHRCHAATGLRG